jgi:hypothetical protein
MAHDASAFVPDYRDQPIRSRLWRTDTPRGIEIVAGYEGVIPAIRRHVRSLPFSAAAYVLLLLLMWWFGSGGFPWGALMFGAFVLMPAFTLIGGVLEGRDGCAVRIRPDGLDVHEQDALRSRWRHWQREQLARAYVNWEGRIVLRGPDGKRLAAIGGRKAGRGDMKWLANLIRQRLDLAT